MRLPKYRRHSLRDFAFVEVDGRRVRLPGPYNSAESREEYGRVLQRLTAPADVIAPPVIESPTVADLVDAWLDWCQGYYPASGQEYVQCCYAAKAVLNNYAGSYLSDFGPRLLKAVRAEMIAAGLSRRCINHRINRIRRMFRWGVEHELVPAAVLEGLRAVAPLRAGRCSAPEPPPVAPVAESAVAATLPYLSPVLRAMVEVQRLTGMRSNNLCRLRPAEIIQEGGAWWYCPEHHKGAWRGKVLRVPLGPRCQAVLAPFLNRDPQRPCFSPVESEAWRGKRHAKRKKRALRDHYDTGSYRRAILYAIRRCNADRKKAGLDPIPSWHPYQLRHSVATTVRERFGLEGSQVYLGHARADVTQLYAERDLALAARIAAEIG